MSMVFARNTQQYTPSIHLLNQCALANNSTPKQIILSIFWDPSKACDVITQIRY